MTSKNTEQQKMNTVSELLAVVEKHGGKFIFADNYGKYWVVEQLKRVSGDELPSQFTCLHDWRYENYDDKLNTFLQRTCAKPSCGLRQRFVTSTAEWKNVWNEKERAHRKEDDPKTVAFQKPVKRA